MLRHVTSVYLIIQVALRGIKAMLCCIMIRQHNMGQVFAPVFILPNHKQLHEHFVPLSVILNLWVTVWSNVFSTYSSIFSKHHSPPSKINTKPNALRCKHFSLMLHFRVFCINWFQNTKKVYLLLVDVNQSIPKIPLG